MLIYFITLLFMLSCAGFVGWALLDRNGVAAGILNQYMGANSSELSSSDVSGDNSSSSQHSGGTYQQRFADAVFVGDSLTLGMSQYGYLKTGQVLASVGLSVGEARTKKIETDFGEMTIVKALGLIEPKTVYIMYGTNGISYLEIDVMIKQYGELIDSFQEVLPNATFCVMSIPPVTTGKEKSSSPIYNKDIDEYNEQLKAFAEERELHFIDLNSCLRDEDGAMPTEYVNSDGMHITKDAYPYVLDFISKNAPN